MLTALGSRWGSVLLAGLVTAVLWTGLAVPTGAAAAPGAEGPGPAMLMPRNDRMDALQCHGALPDAVRTPVLLVPGTSMTPEENWGPGYLPVLRDRDHVVCLVRLPAYATRDVQANAEYVATAIRTMSARSGRPVSVVGHSQGAFLPLAALRTWPDLGAQVDDVVGLAGVYDRGSQRLVARCRLRCTPVLHQLASGSAYLRNIGRRQLPAGPSFTNVGTLADGTVTPQPAANRQPGATSVMLEDVCVGRVVEGHAHGMIAGDAVALALALDALDHPGPASPGRLDRAVCRQDQYPGFDEAAFLAGTGSNPDRMRLVTRAEPALYCRNRQDCGAPRLRGVVTAGRRYAVDRRRVTVRARILLRGSVRVVLGRRTIQRAVRPGPFSVTIRRPAARARLVVKTRPRYYSAWAREDGKWVPLRR